MTRKNKGKCLKALIKYCPRCKRTLSTTEFYKTTKVAKRQRICQWCKECSQLYKREYSRSDKGRDQYLKRTYGITLNEYKKKLKIQNNLCVICSQPEIMHTWGTLVVDHDHKTNQIRGLLCHRCNMFLGNCNENEQLIKNMITYLEKYVN